MIQVDDIHKAVDALKGKVRALNPEPKVRPILTGPLFDDAMVTLQIGAHGKPVVFLHPKDCNGVLIELEQE